MANLRTVDDLKEDALFSANEATDGTSDYEARALVLMNRAYRAIWNGGGEFDPNIDETWWWLLSTAPKVITVLPALSGGSVIVTNNNTGITLTSSPAQDLTGWFFKADDHADIFRVASHAGATAAAVTLDSVYTGNTASAAAYKLFKLQYALATDVLSVNGPMRAYQTSRVEVQGVELSALDREWPLGRITQGVPQEFAHVNEQEVRFSHYGGVTAGDFIRLDYDYLKNPGDLATGSSEPLIPIQYRHIISDVTAAYILQDKDDGKSSEMAVVAQRGLQAMSREHRRRMVVMSRRMGKIQPRQQQLMHTVGPLRTTSGRIIG